jgi:hypothetical protein
MEPEVIKDVEMDVVLVAALAEDNTGTDYNMGTDYNTGIGIDMYMDWSGR